MGRSLTAKRKPLDTEGAKEHAEQAELDRVIKRRVAYELVVGKVEKARKKTRRKRGDQNTED